VANGNRYSSHEVRKTGHKPVLPHFGFADDVLDVVVASMALAPCLPGAALNNEKAG